jgi:hypothetical protein
LHSILNDVQYINEVYENWEQKTEKNAKRANAAAYHKTAMQLFIEKGMDNVSIRAIAEK